ncbi:NAD(P)H-dependent oxidoreductase [Nocardioides zeae]|uniref:NAD(P)H-dependent oxidoreductase n=1 Tax=Nocardioides imazamoxiresistens TaxID=3231893 RepID=A0ABU3PUC9_9ACTN|nr:NAD(P)H-dependent oxidoreductase [Nocardioides zeae]MDT9592839.1 NAD(P)H-dependent oxidoreductase [Nocardioides zeae]
MAELSADRRPGPLRALVVHAHPEPRSFVAAMRDVAVAALEGAGVATTVSDLYAEGFEAVASRRDFATVADPGRFHLQDEQLHASRHDGFVEEVRREQERLAEADLLLLTFPLWWGGVPAVLKGWFDRVLAYGFAYEDGRRYDSGMLTGRHGLLGVSTGGTRRRFSAGDAYGDIEQVLWPTQRCMVEYLGLAAAPPFVAYAAPRVEHAERAAYLDQWAQRVRDLVAAAGG